MPACKTGMTTTQVVEEALRAYLPAPEARVPAGLLRKGAFLVKPTNGQPMSLENVNAALDGVRLKRG